jgi:zinc/manganese transport system permease protein/manganese/iron transport system permease protein
MCAAVAFGTAAVLLGLAVSWYASTAAGASIAASAILLACCSATAHRLRGRLAARRLARHDQVHLPIDRKREMHS